MNSISAFLPCRAGSQRVVNKNTREFSGIKGGIVELKLKQLLKIEIFDEIIFSTDDSVAMEIAASFNDSRIKIIERPIQLCSNSTSVEDLIMYVPTIINSEHIYWTHATAPMVHSDIIRDSIIKYFDAIKNGYDSIMSVTEFKSFLWDDEIGNIINFDRNQIKYPRTQDLKPLYEINHAFYAMRKSLYYSYRDRIGEVPFLYKLSKLESVDIDWNDDFIIAEEIYKKIGRI